MRSLETLLIIRNNLQRVLMNVRSMLRNFASKIVDRNRTRAGIFTVRFHDNEKGRKSCHLHLGQKVSSKQGLEERKTAVIQCGNYFGRICFSLLNHPLFFFFLPSDVHRRIDSRVHRFSLIETLKSAN